MSLSHSALLVAAMSLVTILLRALPFLVFRKNTPDWLAYLGKVLPPAIIGMLVVYCLKDTKISSAPFGIPELISALLVGFVLKNVGLTITKPGDNKRLFEGFGEMTFAEDGIDLDLTMITC